MAEGNGQQELVRAGEVLILQGKEPEYIHFLHSGSMEILSTPQE
jgi:CRP-like cAMP-binding protein